MLLYGYHKGLTAIIIASVALSTMLAIWIVTKTKFIRQFAWKDPSGRRAALNHSLNDHDDESGTFNLAPGVALSTAASSLEDIPS